MSTLSLAISCLTISNLPWLMGLTFQVPMQYCSLQHQTWLPSPVISKTGCCFCFGSISSIFLELLLHWSPIAYWAPTNWGVHLSMSYLFAFSYCSQVLKARILKWFAFPSPVDHILSELSIMTRPSWVALHGMTHSFTELDKAVVHVIILVSFLWLLFPVCLPSKGEGLPYVK